MNKLSNSCSVFHERNIKINHGKEKMLWDVDLAVNKIVFPLHLFNLVAELYAIMVTQERVERSSSVTSIVVKNLRDHRFLYFTVWNFRNIRIDYVERKIIRNMHLTVGRLVLPLHVLSLAAQGYVSVYSHGEVERYATMDRGTIPKMLKDMKINRIFYFTFWTFILQMIFLGLAVCHELSELLKLNLTIRKTLGRARAVIFDTFTFPCTLLTVTVFWTLWHIDRELIFPRALSKVFPDWLNHMLHTFILVPVFVEILAPKKYNFVDYKVAARSLFLFAVVYQSVYLYVYVLHGVWLYPIHEYLGWTGKIILFASKIVALMTFQKIGISFQHRKKKMHSKAIVNTKNTSEECSEKFI
nr:unnamed protein product [Callosobruchus analis]